MLTSGMRRLLGLGGAGILAIGVGATAATAAAHSRNFFKRERPPVLFVAAGSSGPGFGFGCSAAAFSSISAAVSAAPSGATIIVCPGTYAEDVTVEKPLTIEGIHATVAPDGSDASPLTPLTGGNNGFTVLSPWVTVRGFTVTGASSDGIAVFGDHARIEDNVVTDNGLGDTNNPGNGIDLDGSSFSRVSGNTVSGSGNGGIQLANDPDAAGLSTVCSALEISCAGITGTATHDVVVHNNVNNNPYACGILLVDHDGTDGSAANLTDGIYDNVVARNSVVDNADQGYGAGILLASEVPGGAVYDNLITRNDVSGNGLAGLTLHSHLGGVNQDLNGNVIIRNDFGTNNTKDEEASDPQTTGVFIGSEDHLDITVAQNTIHNDYYGVFTASPNGVTVHGLNTNHYVADTIAWYASSSYSG